MEDPQTRTIAEVIALDSVKSYKQKIDLDDDSLCHECLEPLTVDDMQIGYECETCRLDWMTNAMGEIG